MRISVIGCGYLGAVHAASMAELGHEVVGIDVDPGKVQALAAGEAPFFEPGLPEILESAMETGRLRFSTRTADAAGAQVHFIAVGTPQARGGGAADLTYVDAAIEALLPHLGDGDLVVGKSTVPVGTAARLARVGARRVGRGSRVEPGVPARGIRGEGHDHTRPARVRAAGGRRPRARQGTARRGLCDGDRRRDPARRRRLRDGRTREGRSERVPRDQDQLHQRDGRDLRGRRRGRDRARGRDRLRRADRPAVPERRHRVRGRLPAEGHPRVHRSRGGARPWRVGRVPEGDRRDQPAPPPADGRHGRRGARRAGVPEEGHRARARVQARLRRRPRLARRSTSRCS